MGNIEASRQCVSFGPRGQVLNSRSVTDFVTKVAMDRMMRGRGSRKMDL